MQLIESIDEIKKIQLDILLAVHRFCEDNGIKYSLAAGTLIGAIRPQGYIPWDDDIDIYLQREDYKKLIAIFPELFEERYKLYSLERNSEYTRPYARLCDCTTLEVFSCDSSIKPLGLGIDIFPIDYVPDDEQEWQSYNRKRLFLYKIYRKKVWVKWEHSCGLMRNLGAMLLKALLSPFSYRFLAKQIDRYAQINNGRGFHHLFETGMGIVATKHFPAEDMAETIDVPFEGHQLKAMKGYDDYLRAFYGDYMQLPPVEKRVSHHEFKAYRL